MTAQASNAQREPSMEEILASIRRIIEDSDTAKNEDPIVGMGFGEEGSQATPAEDWNEAGATFGEETYSHGESPSAGENDDAPPRSMMEIQAGTPRRESSGAEIHPHPAIGRTSELEEYPREEGLDEPQSHEQAVPFAPVFSDDTGEDDQAEPTEPQFDLMSETEMFAALQGMDDAEKAMDRPSAADPLNEPSSIISDQAGRQVSAAFGELSNAMEVNRRRQMDRMARDMLRPMLQEWLDNNLPSLVEKLVREEIQRVARGG